MVNLAKLRDGVLHVNSAAPRKAKNSSSGFHFLANQGTPPDTWSYYSVFSLACFCDSDWCLISESHLNDIWYIQSALFGSPTLLTSFRNQHQLPTSASRLFHHSPRKIFFRRVMPYLCIYETRYVCGKASANWSNSQHNNSSTWTEALYSVCTLKKAWLRSGPRGVERVRENRRHQDLQRAPNTLLVRIKACTCSHNDRKSSHGVQGSGRSWWAEFLWY